MSLTRGALFACACKAFGVTLPVLLDMGLTTDDLAGAAAYELGGAAVCLPSGDDAPAREAGDAIMRTAGKVDAETFTFAEMEGLT